MRWLQYAKSHVEPDLQIVEKRRCRAKLISFLGGHIFGPPNVIEKAMSWVS